MFMKKFIDLSAAVRELSCVQRKKTQRKTNRSLSLPRTATRKPS